VNDQITITISGGDRFGQFNVQARCGELEYPDFFNPLNAWRRTVFAQNVASRFGWEGTPDELERIENVVVSELRRMEQSSGPLTERVEAPNFREMRSEEIEWLWPGRIAVGKLCVIAGDPGLGKSLLTLDIAAHASRGAPWPDESGFSPVASVFLLSAEDDYGDTVRPRLEAAGADLDRVFAVTGVYSGEGELKTGRNLDISQDLDKLRSTIESVPPPRVLVIDPISSFLGAAGENANAEIRKLLEPVTVFAQETKTAVIIVSHMRKAEGSNLHRIIGSIAFAAVARSAFVVVRVKDLGGQLRRIVPVKNNLGGTK
jgi:putative DNA primase/helicase